VNVRFAPRMTHGSAKPFVRFGVSVRSCAPPVPDPQNRHFRPAVAHNRVSLTATDPEEVRHFRHGEQAKIQPSPALAVMWAADEARGIDSRAPTPVVTGGDYAAASNAALARRSAEGLNRTESDTSEGAI